MLVVPLRDYNVRVRTSYALVGHATYNTQHMNALSVVNTYAIATKCHLKNKESV